MVLADVNQQAGEKALAQVLAAAGAASSPAAVFVKADVSKDTDVKTLVDTAERTFGTILFFSIIAIYFCYLSA